MDRNFIIAIVLSMAIFMGYSALVLEPQQRAYEEAVAQQQELENARRAAEGLPPLSEEEALIAPTADRVTDVVVSREEALADTPGRLRVETPRLSGSINLEGLVFDDMTLLSYRETTDDTSPNIVLLTPATTRGARFITTGLGVGGDQGLNDVWTITDGDTLTPDTPVTLTKTVNGVEHQVILSVDDQYMFAVEHTVVNRSGGDVVASPFGVTYQRDVPEDLINFMILFEGPLGVVGDTPFARKYQKMINEGGIKETGVGGWVGITDKYWLGAAIPPQDQQITGSIDVTSGARPLFASSYQMDPIIVPNGQGTSVTSHVYAGAKVVEILRSYERSTEDGGLGISEFDMAVDWGNFFILTRPIFNVLHFFNGIVGNYGIAILLLTLAIKAVLYPLANMSYKSMAGMRKVQPELVKLKERYAEDKVKQQQEMMELYKKHKINPAAGCLPILLQMPIFYALYKTLFVTIEMRHEGFLYIPDLSEPDPTSIFNLFGLLPYDPTQLPLIGPFLGIGVLALLMGAGMWVQMKLNPPPTDPLQAKIFAYMPILFVFLFAQFAAGLVLYWAWNTILSVIQQYIIMRRNDVDVDLIGNIKTSLGLAKPASEDRPSSN